MCKLYKLVTFPVAAIYYYMKVVLIFMSVNEILKLCR